MKMNARTALITWTTLTLAFLPRATQASFSFSPTTISDVAERVTPAVVSITVQKTETIRSSGHPLENHPMFKDFFRNDGRRQRRSAGAGSGVVISSDGYIVTNNHVIEGTDKIKVAFADGRTYAAKLIGTDKSSDVALIKVKGKSFPFLEFGNSKDIRLGEFVLAIGNPFGVGQTVTMGIVSAKGRANIGIVDYEDFIQTDAAINPGNSGGALVNLEGKLIGINTAILSRSGGYQGIGFAVPANMVQPILKQLQAHGRVRRGWLGVAIQNLTPDLAKQLNIKAEYGVLIGDVLDTGPAGKAGLQAGDVITSVNNKPCRSASGLRNHIALLGPNTKVKIKLMRNGKAKTIKVNLEEKEDLQAVEGNVEADNSLFSGVQLKTLNSALRNRLEAPQHLKGVVVTDLSPDSSAADVGLRPGDVITSVNQDKIESASALIDLGRKRDKLLLRVWRKGHSSFMVLKR